MTITIIASHESLEKSITCSPFHSILSKFTQSLESNIEFFSERILNDSEGYNNSSLKSLSLSDRSIHTSRNSIPGVVAFGYGFGSYNGFKGDSINYQANDLEDELLNSISNEYFDFQGVSSSNHTMNIDATSHLLYHYALTQSLYQYFISKDSFELNRFTAIKFLKKELHLTLENIILPTLESNNLEEFNKTNELKVTKDKLNRINNEKNNDFYSKLDINDIIKKIYTLTHFNISDNYILKNILFKVPNYLILQGLDWNEMNSTLWRFVFYHILNGESWCCNIEKNFVPNFPNIQFVLVLSSDIESISTFDGIIIEGKKFTNQEITTQLPSIQDYFKVHESNTKINGNIQQESIKPLRILLFSSPLKLIHTKSKYNFELSSDQDFKDWISKENEFTLKVIEMIKPLKINVLICQWDISPEIVNKLDSELNCSTIQYMTGNYLQKISELANASICFQLEDVNENMVGILKKLVPINYRPLDDNGFALVFEKYNQKIIDYEYKFNSIQSIVIHTSHPYSGQQIIELILNISKTLFSIMYRNKGIAIFGDAVLELFLHSFLKKLAEERNRCILTEKLASAFLATIRQLAMSEGIEQYDDIINILVDKYDSILESIKKNNFNSYNKEEIFNIMTKYSLHGILNQSRIDNLEIIKFESPALKWNKICHCMDTVSSMLKVDQIIEIEDAIDM